jgi:hypothetical protein
MILHPYSDHTSISIHPDKKSVAPNSGCGTGWIPNGTFVNVDENCSNRAHGGGVAYFAKWQ